MSEGRERKSSRDGRPKESRQRKSDAEGPTPVPVPPPSGEGRERRPKDAKEKRDREGRPERSDRPDRERREDREARRESQNKPAKNDGDMEAWLDGQIAEINDGARRGSGRQKSSDGSERKIPKRPSSRADSRPSSRAQAGGQVREFDAAPLAGVESSGKSRPDKPQRPSDQEKRQRPPVDPSAGNHSEGKPPPAPPPVPKQQAPPGMSEVPLDDDIESEPEVNGKKRSSKETPRPAKPAVFPTSQPTNAQSPKGISQVEEEIAVEEEVGGGGAEYAMDDFEEIDYADDFCEASEDEEYQPQIKPAMAPSPTYEGDGKASAKVITVRPDSQGMRAASPGFGMAMEQADLSSIKKAMETEKLKAQQNSSAMSTVPDVSAGKKGFLGNYETTTMPKIKVSTSSTSSQKAAVQRIDDLKKLKVFARRTREKFDLFSQAPQSIHSLFLSGKGTKYAKLKTEGVQTRDDDMEVGTQTDEPMLDDKETQFPVLTGSSTTGREATQLLPFLRRTLPLFEASMAEASLREQASVEQGGADAQSRMSSQVRCRLPEDFTDAFIGPQARIVDIAISPKWYGADHSLVLYTWPWVSGRPAVSSAGKLDSFMRPLQSLVGVYPLIGTIDGADVDSTRPSRCLYSFCRLNSIAVVTGRPHLIIAGSEMGSLLVWDLRNKAHGPIEHLNAKDEGTQVANGTESGLTHFEGPIWLDSAFSTDGFAISSNAVQDNDDALDADDPAGSRVRAIDDSIGAIHQTEIRSVRCSDGAGGDSLIYALDAMGVVSFWRVLEIPSATGYMIKLALQGHTSVNASGCLLSFLDACGICVHPQQQAQFIVWSSSGVHQANRQQMAASSITDGPSMLELKPSGRRATLELRFQLDVSGAEVPDVFGSQDPCSASFNPFMPNLLLVCYSCGDIALFDCSLCVPITHWGNAVHTAPNKNISIAWSSSRPCVFFVKSGNMLEVWDLVEKTYSPVKEIDLTLYLGQSQAYPGSAEPCSELHVSPAGQPVVACNTAAMLLRLPPSLVAPIQSVPPQYTRPEQLMDELVKPHYAKTAIFPTLQQHQRPLQLPPQYHTEVVLLQRVLASIPPLHAARFSEPL